MSPNIQNRFCRKAQLLVHSSKRRRKLQQLHMIARIAPEPMLKQSCHESTPAAVAGQLLLAMNCRVGDYPQFRLYLSVCGVNAVRVLPRFYTTLYGCDRSATQSLQETNFRVLRFLGNTGLCCH